MTIKKTSEWTPPKEYRDGGKALRPRDRNERNLKNTLRASANLRYLRQASYEIDNDKEES